MTGRFISFEGGEGSGKSTQSGILAERLRAHGVTVVQTREPGGTTGAEEIRALFVNGSPERWYAATEALLINAARADHVARCIRPALARGVWVLCDRYADSTFAYQGAGKGADVTDLSVLHEIATGGLWPDLTLWIDISVEAGLSRAAQRSGGEARFEAHDRAFHARVAQGFAARALAEPTRIVRIDGDANIEDVAAQIWTHILPLPPC